jgi:uncharacterized membrane protein
MKPLLSTPILRLATALHLLFAAGLFYLMVQGQPTVGRVLIATVVGLPLWVVAVGLFRQHLYTCKVATLLLSFYVPALLVEAYMFSSQRLAFTALATVAALDFTALMLYVRFVGREKAAGLSG